MEQNDGPDKLRFVYDDEDNTPMTAELLPRYKIRSLEEAQREWARAEMAKKQANG